MQHDEICLVVDADVILLKVDVITNDKREIRTIVTYGGTETINEVAYRLSEKCRNEFIDDFNRVYEYCQDMPRISENKYCYRSDNMLETAVYTISVMMAELTIKYIASGLDVVF